MRYLVLFLLSIFLVLPGIATVPPVDRDESRYVQATKQMLETGDYVDIRMQEVARYKKPIGIYWMQAAAINISGMGADAPIWAYRLVSVLGIALSVVATCWIGTRLFSPNAGFIAALMLAGIFGVAFEGRLAKTDAMLVAVTVLAQGALAQIFVASRNGARVAGHLRWTFWVAQGVAILIKGPIAPLASALTIATLFIFRRDARWLKELKAARGLLIVAVIVLPWLVLISWKSGGAFWQEAVGKDLLGKVGGAQESHGAPPGYYVLTYALYFWPFGLLALGGGLRAWNSAKADPRLLFLLAWYVPFWLFFEIIPTKLPHYVLPAYPALCLLAGWAMTIPKEEAEQALRPWQRWLWWLAAVGQVVVSLGIAIGVVAAPIYLQGAVYPLSLVAAAFALAAGYLAFPTGIQLSIRRVALATISAGVAYILIFTFVLPSLSAMWISPRVAEMVSQNHPCDESVLASSRFHEPSMVFLVGTRTKLTGLAGVAEHLASDPQCALALVMQDEVEPLRDLVAKDGHALKSLGRIDGVNYSKGDHLSMELFRVDD